MNKKHIFVILAVVMISVSVSATEAKEAKEPEKKEGTVKKELKNHFKFYGFIRNFFAFDTRESVAGTGDLFYWVPKDVNENALGEDLNESNSFRFLALTSRVGVDVSGYQVGRTKFGAKVEADFYAGLSGSTGTANMRMRQAYATIGWDNLPMAGEAKASVGLKVGQAWHPMAADQPSVLGLETGAPFHPFSRTPQVTMDASLGDHFIITGSALWQMQYTSMGPEGSSANYIEYSCIPEFYAGLAFKTKNGLLMRLGANMLSIKPRRLGTVTGTDPDTGLPVTTTGRVSDRLTTVSPYFFLQYKYRSFLLKAKTVYGSGGEHFGLMSGYGITKEDNGSYNYAPLHNTSSWISLSLGKTVQGQLFVGYMKNLGTSEQLLSMGGLNEDFTEASDVYFNKNGFSNLNQMYRITPSVVYNVGKFSLGLEYSLTSARYGEYAERRIPDDGGDTVVKVLNRNGLATDNLHWVTNHRIQMMVKFTF